MSLVPISTNIPIPLDRPKPDGPGGPAVGEIIREGIAWRKNLRPASYKGAVFHVETEIIAGGQRVALHEYPKKNIPYAERMGRKAERHTVTGYVLVSPGREDYTVRRDALIAMLRSGGTGQLVHPSLGEETVVAETWSVIETRAKGGMAVFEMVFTEAGQAPGITASAVPSARVPQLARDLMQRAAEAYRPPVLPPNPFPSIPGGSP